MRLFIFSNVWIYSYKFAINFCHCCFSCVLQILIWCIFIFIQFNILKKISLKTFSLIHGLFRSVLFSLPVGNFVDIFLLLILISLHYGWKTHSNGLNSLNLLFFFFSWPRMYKLSWYMFHGHMISTVFYCCWYLLCSINVNKILLIDNVVKLF